MKLIFKNISYKTIQYIIMIAKIFFNLLKLNQIHPPYQSNRILLVIF